jgi:transcriptional regulator with XRE-family HTH domain
MNTALSSEQPAIGERVRIWRTAAKMSGAALAEKLGISRGKVSELESGSFLPGVKVALAIEALSEGAINAGDLNEDVKAARHGVGFTAKGAQDHVV